MVRWPSDEPRTVPDPADLEALTVCGPLTLMEAKLSGMELMDTEGRRWAVRSVRRMGPAKSGLARLVEPLLYGKRTSRIGHELSALTPLQLAEVKDRLGAGIEAFPDDWGDDAEKVAGRWAEVRAVDHRRGSYGAGSHGAVTSFRRGIGAPLIVREPIVTSHSARRAA